MQTTTQTPAGFDITDSARVLLTGLIDYAGLFPPAALAMPQTVANYQGYSRSNFSWMLGRLVIPAARSNEFESARTQLENPEHQPEPHWPLSVLLGNDPVSDLQRIKISATDASKVTIPSFELKGGSPQEIETFSNALPRESEVYFETALSPNLPDCIAAIAACGRRAKIRTGGETADKFPPPESIIEFIQLCAKNKVPFKATAGLHHPIRSRHRLTYQPDSPSATMYGFLNVFLAAAFLYAGHEASVALQVLQEEDPQAFHFDSSGIAWRDHRLDTRNLAAARKQFAISFGSCSFTEPVDDLRALHLL